MYLQYIIVIAHLLLLIFTDRVNFVESHICMKMGRTLCNEKMNVSALDKGNVLDIYYYVNQPRLA